MKAPDYDVILHTGERRPFRELFAERPAILVFLRHAGCVFCKEHVAQLRERPDLNVLFVTMGSPEQALEFKEKMNSPHVFLSDPQQALYRAFGLGRGSFGQMFNLKTVRRGMEATKAGHRAGIPVGDPWQLSGTFVIDTAGDVVWSYRNRDASDNPTPTEIESHLPATMSA